MKVNVKNPVLGGCNLPFYFAILNVCAASFSVRELFPRLSFLSAHFAGHSFRWFVDDVGRFSLIEIIECHEVFFASLVFVID